MSADSSLPLEHPSFPTNDREEIRAGCSSSELHRNTSRTSARLNADIDIEPHVITLLKKSQHRSRDNSKGKLPTPNLIEHWNTSLAEVYSRLNGGKHYSVEEKFPQLRNASKLYWLCILSSLCVPKCWTTMLRGLSSRMPGLTVFPRSYSDFGNPFQSTQVSTTLLSKHHGSFSLAISFILSSLSVKQIPA